MSVESLLRVGYLIFLVIIVAVMGGCETCTEGALAVLFFLLVGLVWGMGGLLHERPWQSRAFWLIPPALFVFGILYWPRQYGYTSAVLLGVLFFAASVTVVLVGLGWPLVTVVTKRLRRPR